MDIYGKDFWNFISENSCKEPDALRLSVKKEKYEFDVEFAITQIECRKKTANKLKWFLDNPNFLFPDYISSEQASHQAIGHYHASLVSNKAEVLDMSAGLGVDTFSFSKKGLNVTSIELNQKKAEIIETNAKTLGFNSIKVINGDSMNFLKEGNNHFDLIFIDPSRRDQASKRVYNLRDCSPDVITNQNLLVDHADKVLIKASPLLDISQTIKDFKNITSIRAVGVKGECKELLIELQKNKSLKDINNSIKIEAINLDNEGNIINLFSDEGNVGMKGEKNSQITYASKEDIQNGFYLLEPSPMVMKLAPWDRICNLYNAKKMGKSSHLFLSSSLPNNFPGRVTKIENLLKRQDRKTLVGFPVSVISKNYPASSDEIRKVYSLKEGDENFIYATRLGEKPILLLSKQI